jgi:hypothetical protein
MFAIGAPPEFVTVNVNGALAEFTCCAAKLRLVGLTLIAGGVSPDPVSATVCVRSKSETVSVAVWPPTWVGANTTEIEQLAGPVNWVPQLFDC